MYAFLLRGCVCCTCWFPRTFIFFENERSANRERELARVCVCMVAYSSMIENERRKGDVRQQAEID